MGGKGVVILSGHQKKATERRKAKHDELVA